MGSSILRYGVIWLLKFNVLLPQYFKISKVEIFNITESAFSKTISHILLPHTELQ